MKVFLIFLFFFVFVSYEVIALKCYICTKTPNSGDDACVEDPESLGKSAIMNCNKKYCTIFRQELLDPAGKVNSFSRGCEDEPIFLDHIETDAQFKTYYRSCTEELCNDYDAVNIGTNANNPDRSGGANFVAKGMEDNGSGSKEASVLVIILSLIMTIMMKLL